MRQPLTSSSRLLERACVSLKKISDLSFSSVSDKPERKWFYRVGIAEKNRQADKAYLLTTRQLLSHFFTGSKGILKQALAVKELWNRQLPMSKMKRSGWSTLEVDDILLSFLYLVLFQRSGSMIVVKMIGVCPPISRGMWHRTAHIHMVEVS